MHAHVKKALVHACRCTVTFALMLVNSQPHQGDGTYIHRVLLRSRLRSGVVRLAFDNSMHRELSAKLLDKF
eukprot:7922346-Alexandrium_andersonii.AAC.1